MERRKAEILVILVVVVDVLCDPTRHSNDIDRPLYSSFPTDVMCNIVDDILLLIWYVDYYDDMTWPFRLVIDI